MNVKTNNKQIDAKAVFGNIGEVYEANHQFWMKHLLPMLNYSRETRQPLNPAMFEDGFLQVIFCCFLSHDKI